jgi:hypothetical protein
VTHPRRRKGDVPPADERVEPVEPFVPPDTPDPVPAPNDEPAKTKAIDSDFTPEKPADEPTADKRSGLRGLHGAG